MLKFKEYIAEAKALQPLVTLLGVFPGVIDSIQAVHWNVKGPNFGDIHADTGAIYTMFIGWQDKIAERIKALNTGFQVTKGTSQDAPDVTDQAKAIAIVLSSLNTMKGAIQTAAKTVDAPTANMLQELEVEVDKWIWKFTNSQ